MTAPAIVRTRIRHVRHHPIRHEFCYRGYSWLVDLDALPELPPLLRPFARFRTADHLGDPTASLRTNIDGYLASEGIDLRGGRVRMLTNPRVLGVVFNPLTVYWCHDGAGTLVCVVAEVHNTYGERHRYLVLPDSKGNATVAKAFYVSPFNAVSGTYRLHLPEPSDRLGLVITLENPSGVTLFTASMTGRSTPADNWTVARTVLRMPIAPMLVALRIRWQGIRLWLRRLPLQPRSLPQENLR
ncbi:DUF1365 domain-containing protein [Jongsikchunia kroppenstedtii]|uniref:DUF1365 domain-containing protein n=1 Tax=Jongsikchunia kroppenstedtii TaxID=1121721 RepID=UPI00035D4144|nr:DUF1365 domain-containing protein [Jongsikchunia kroppenstedtii]